MNLRFRVCLSAVLLLAQCSSGKVSSGEEKEAAAEGGLETCSAAGCDGCCAASACLPGVVDNACGSGGTPCIICSETQQCQQGICRDKPSSCDFSSCGGCCKDGKCHKGVYADLCGKDGTACKPCGSDEWCDQGTCVKGSATCNATSCKDGCCQLGASIRCLSGREHDLCGTGGNLCLTCLASQTCQDGLCRKGTDPPCGPDVCPGCCRGGVECVGGTDHQACGKGGIYCLLCFASQTCEDGECKAR